MNQKLQQGNFEERVKELLAFAKEKEIFISAVQEVDKQGRINTVPLYRDLKQYVRDVETTSTPTGTDVKVETSENTGTNA